jgi:hypothetical protein
MKRLLLPSISMLLVKAALAQPPKFIEQLGFGYNPGIRANAFSPAGNTGGFAFGTIGDFLFHNRFGYGLGFDINIIQMHNVEEWVSPFFADFRFMGCGKWKPYLALDPGYCLYYSSLKNGDIQKGSWYAAAAAGLWFPSKYVMHFFVQAKYNYLMTSTSYGGTARNVSGSLNTFSFLAGYAF